MRYAGIGIQLAGSVLLFVYLGQWLDRKLGTGGLITALGALLAFAGTLWSLIRMLKKDEREGR